MNRYAIAALLLGLFVHAVAGCDKPSAPGTSSPDSPSSRTLKARLAGTTWVQPEGHKITLGADGTARHSNPEYNGTWEPAGERTILIRFKNGFVSVWSFDEGLMNFTGGHFKPDADQKGVREDARSK